MALGKCPQIGTACKRIAENEARVAQIGPQGAITLTAVTGIYTTIAMLLVAFWAAAPDEAGHPFAA